MFCPVANGITKRVTDDHYVEYNTEYSQEEPEPEQGYTSCITCLSELAFGGDIGGRLSSTRQAQQDTYAETNAIEPEEKNTYAEVAKLGGRINSINAAEQGQWEVIRGQVDSVAAVTICGKEVAKHCPVSKTEKSRQGVYYMSASDDPIYNIGEQRIEGISEEWAHVDLASQVGSTIAGFLIAVVDLMDKGESSGRC